MSDVLISLPLAHFGLQVRANRRLRYPISRRLEEGSRPSLIKCVDNVDNIDRSDLEEKLSKILRPSAVEWQVGVLKHFGVMLGPSGTGKTALVRQLCARYPHGVLYHEIFEQAADSTTT